MNDAEPNSDADALARRCADAMWRDDAASPAMGMSLDFVASGRARMSMRVRSDMVNGHGLCHGGLIFSLADSAMAFAANSHGDRAVAQHCSVTFVRPAREGELLTAAAEERSRAGRSGIYDVRVTGSSDGSVVAEFRGHSRLTGGRFFSDDG
jgi:acyl-CoA thioesterase